jgi:hypoxanthine phosphoribosyltransferase
LTEVLEKTLIRNVSWDEVTNHAEEIADRIAKKDTVTCVVGVGRGGLIPAVIISHHLNVPLVPIMWQTRDGKYKTDLRSIVETLSHGDTVLVIDDISDSGETLSQIVGMINHVAVELKKQVTVVTAAIHQKPESTFYVHEMGEFVNQDTWIVYPWEA